MVSGKHILVLILVIIVLPLALEGSREAEDSADSGIAPMSNPRGTLVTIIEDDPVIGLLGMRFEEIKGTLGEPDDQGYDEVFGPNNYMHYGVGEGFMRFLSPASIEDPIALSIILGPGQEILGVEVGMSFDEITSLLGSPDSGPELGMDDTYYMDYFLGEIDYGVPDIVVSFSAECPSCPTLDAFVKREEFVGGHVASLR